LIHNYVHAKTTLKRSNYHIELKLELKKK